MRIDVAIAHPSRPGRFVLAVEADGTGYHAVPTVRDRDRLRQQVLEALGWRYHRIWTTDWFADADAEVAKVIDAVEQARVVVGDDVARPTVDADPAPVDAEPPWAARAPQRSAAPGFVQPGAPITAYRHEQLVELAAWVRSDTLLRTEEQLLGELMDVLGLQRRAPASSAPSRPPSARSEPDDAEAVDPLGSPAPAPSAWGLRRR